MVCFSLLLCENAVYLISIQSGLNSKYHSLGVLISKYIDVSVYIFR
jgi:hypothetical protein